MVPEASQAGLSFLSLSPLLFCLSCFSVSICMCVFGGLISFRGGSSCFLRLPPGSSPIRDQLIIVTCGSLANQAGYLRRDQTVVCMVKPSALHALVITLKTATPKKLCSPVIYCQADPCRALINIFKNPVFSRWPGRHSNQV